MERFLKMEIEKMKSLALWFLAVISSSVLTSHKQTPVKNEQRILLELVAQNSQPIDVQQLKKILVDHTADPGSLYHWQNHVVIFDSVQDVSLLKTKLQKAFPQLLVKMYVDLVYKFDRKVHCNNPVIAREWDQIILTANLVKDAKMQQEYLDYHATQFKEWPEVANGFCHADFQQLLVYKNGRQLVLIISIPKGESLDKLNPRTTENNPRVDQWNELMKKYQEGIAGTKAGEVWVFLKKV